MECLSPPHHAFPGNIETPLLEEPEQDDVELVQLEGLDPDNTSNKSTRSNMAFGGLA